MQATLLKGGTVVELDPPRIQQRDLLLVGSKLSDGPAPPGVRTVDCTGCVILPGLVVAHTHAYSALAAGMPVPAEPATTFKQILEKVWWRLDEALDADSLRASARIAAMDALKNGVSCVIDHHESPNFIDGSLDVIAEAFEEVGVRAVLTYGATDRHGADGAKAGLRESERFVNKAQGQFRGMIGLHAPFTCTDSTLTAAAGLSKDLGAWLHYHAAEGPDDQAAAQTRWQQRLFLHLAEQGLVHARTLLAHGVQMDPIEVERIEASGAWLCHQARSNMNNGVGYAGALADLSRVALGTDGIDDDLLAELKSAFFRRREFAGPSAWPDPVATLGQGHRLAAQLFGLPLGGLHSGAPADLTVLSYDPPTPLTEASLGAHLLFGLSSRDVRDVYVQGVPTLESGRLQRVDEPALRADARRQADALFARMR